jgi:hypothetical protein
MGIAEFSLRRLLLGAVGDEDGDAVEDWIGSVAGGADDLVLCETEGLVASWAS